MARPTAEDKRLQVQQHGSEDMESYRYYKNSVFKVFAGTQAAVVRWKMGPGEGNALRMEQQRQAIEAAVGVYEDRWGPVDWWLAEVICTHTTNSIVVEVRVGTV